MTFSLLTEHGAAAFRSPQSLEVLQGAVSTQLLSGQCDQSQLSATLTLRLSCLREMGVLPD